MEQKSKYTITGKDSSDKAAKSQLEIPFIQTKGPILDQRAKIVSISINRDKRKTELIRKIISSTPSF